MANTLEFSISTIAADRLSGTLSDDTTYGTPARADTGLFVKGQKMTHTSTVDFDLTVTGDQDDPETDSEFTFNIPASDGWMRFLIVSIPDFNSSSTYAIYDAVYDGASGNVYRSKQNGNTTDTLSDTVWWELITDPASLASNEGESNESANIDSTIYEPLVIPNEEYGFANVIAEASEQYLTSLEIPDDDLSTYALLALLIDGCVVYGDRSQMSQGERVVMKLQALIEELD